MRVGLKKRTPLTYLLIRGFEDTNDIELLELVLSGGAGRSSREVAAELLERYGDVLGLMRSEVKELVRIRGVGVKSALRIKAALELARRGFLRERLEKTVKVGSPSDLAEIMIPELKGLDREHFKAVLLNTKNVIVRIVTVAIGSLNAALVHPRETFKTAVSSSAASLILVHNHPTGDPEPSREDEELTKRFAEAGRLLGIELLDHIIIGDGRFVSLRERGLIEIR